MRKLDSPMVPGDALAIPMVLHPSQRSQGASRSRPADQTRWPQNDVLELERGAVPHGPLGHVLARERGRLNVGRTGLALDAHAASDVRTGERPMPPMKRRASILHAPTRAARRGAPSRRSRRPGVSFFPRAADTATGSEQGLHPIPVWRRRPCKKRSGGEEGRMRRSQVSWRRLFWVFQPIQPRDAEPLAGPGSRSESGCGCWS